LKDEQSRPGLKRNVSLFQAIMYGVGLILGAGIYVLIGDAAGVAGNAMWISFIIAAIIATFTGLSYAELSSALPKSAAEYVFVKNAFGNNLVAFVTGWLITFVAVVSAAAVAIGFSGYLATFIPQIDPVISASVLVIGMSAVNFIGMRESMWMNTTFTLVELLGLAIVVWAAISLGSLSQADYFEMPPATAGSLALSVGALLGAATLVFFAYFGFENLANIAEETKNASRNIPRALIVSIVVTTGIYIVIALSAVALVGWERLSATEAPLALAAEQAFGKTGATVLAAIALFATSNTVLMMLVAGSRIMFGLSRERALPSSLGRVHSKTKTPWISIVLAMLMACGIIVLSEGSISVVAKAAVLTIFLVYALVNLSLIWIRYRLPGLERPFKSPLSIGRFPVLAGLGLVTSVIMLTQFDSTSVIVGIITIIIALVSYVAITRYRMSAQRRVGKA
jgi:APA family basic amino acid/polyamine antiporter